MQIKILGPGCPNCGEVEKRVINVLAEMNIAADVEKITDIKKIMAFGVLATPSLIINGKVVCSGRVPRAEDIRTWIREAAD